MKHFFATIMIILGACGFVTAQDVPELIYLKFNSGTTTTPNDAGAGTSLSASATLHGGLTIGGTGMVGTGLIGTGASSSSDYVDIGSTANVTGSYTISFWAANVPSLPSTGYLFGCTSNGMRCFTGGVAGTGLYFRLDNTYTVDLSTLVQFQNASTPAAYTFTYDATTGVAKGYKDGVLLTTTTGVPSTMNIDMSTFKIGGYSSNDGLSGTMDEFRLYNRALTDAEILATYNQELPLTQCSGQPVAGTVPDSIEVCSGVAAAISSTGSSIGGGIHFQWQTRATSNDPWANIVGALGSSYGPSGGFSTAGQYRFFITCDSSGLADTSGITQVTIAPASQCYCIPTSTSTTYGITHFQTTGAIINIDHSSAGGQGYVNNSATDIASQIPGGTVNFSVDVVPTEGVGIWVDWNDNGNFTDPGEQVFSSGSYVTSTSGSFVIPVTATPGVHRMRVVGNWLNVTPTPCGDLGNAGYGEAEDYGLEVIQLLPCTGSVAAGAISSPDTIHICAGIAFNLSDTGYTAPAANLTYQWQQRSPAGTGTWQNISGANFPSVSFPNGITSNTDYRFYLVCNNSSSSDTSALVTVVMNPGSQCYCTPVYTWDCSDGDEISNVTLVGTSVNINNSTSCSPAGFGDYTAMPAPDLVPALSYNISIATDYGSPTSENVRAWIDWNNDGMFDTSEIIADASAVAGSGLSSSGSSTFNFTVPPTAIAGNHRMRVRLAYFSSDIDPCDNYSYGETEDYTVNVIALTPCSGTPSAGAIDTSATFGVCANNPFSITDTGFTVAANMTYQWQQRNPSGTGTWQDITGANSSMLSFPNGITSATDYRFYVVCSNSNSSDTSAAVTATMNPGTQCYCTPTTQEGCDFGTEITNVSLNGSTVSLNNTTTCSPNGGYGDYTSLAAPDLAPNQAYQISVTTDYFYPSDENVRVWIDWNDDGTFDSNELIADGATNYGGGFGSNGVGTYSFIVPATATAGTHRMRVRMVDYTMNIDPCDNTYYEGETEDYNISVISLTPCSGTPTAGSIDTTTTFGVCAGVPFNLNVAGATLAANMTYQWQQRNPSGTGSWTNITGANSFFLSLPNGIMSATDYRFYVVCSNSNSADTSAVVTATMNPGNQCYCTPMYTTNCSVGDEISNVTLNGTTVSINNSTSCSPAGYGDYTSLPAPDLIPTLSYNISITTDYPYPSDENARAWIDWNNDGLFDASEIIAEASTIAGSGLAAGGSTFSFTVPVTAIPGNHRMRVRLAYYTSDIDPCDNYSYGETEDYTVTVVGANCTTVADTLTALGVGSTSAILSWTGQVAEYLIEYGAPGFALGTGTQVLANSNPDTLTGLNPNTAYEFYVQNICYPGIDSADWSLAPGSFHTICDTPLVNLGADTIICEGQPLTLSTGNSNAGNTYLWSDGSTNSTLSVDATGTYWVTLTSQFDCSHTDSIVVTVTPLPHIDDITAVHNGDDSYTFTANNVIGAVNYNWDFGDGQGFSSAAHPTYLYGAYGDYTVTLVISNACGSDTTQLIVHYTPDGIHQVDPGKNQLKLYPNPAKDIVTLKNESSQKMQTIEVYNVLGQRVFRGDAQGNETYQLHVDGYASGMYSVKIFFEDGTWAQRKFEIAK